VSNGVVRDPSPCVEGSAFDTNQGGGRCVRDLDRPTSTAPANATADPSRWTHRVGVAGNVRDSAGKH